MEEVKVDTQTSEMDLHTETDGKLDELMSQIIDYQVEINHIERDSQRDVWSSLQCELDDVDTSFRNWITEMEVMFMTFVFEANDIIKQLMRDQLSLAESIDCMVEEASFDLHPSIHLDDSELENDVINDLSISDALVVITVQTVSRDLDALTSSHDSILDDIVSTELACEKREYAIKEDGQMHIIVSKTVGDFLLQKAERQARRAQLASRNYAVQPTIEVNSICKPTPKKKSTLRSFMDRIRSVAFRNRRAHSYEYVERRDG